MSFITTYMQSKHGNKVKLWYLDTDSFCEIETEDLYKSITIDLEKKFDKSRYSKNDNRPLYNNCITTEARGYLTWYNHNRRPITDSLFIDIFRTIQCSFIIFKDYKNSHKVRMYFKQYAEEAMKCAVSIKWAITFQHPLIFTTKIA